MIGAERPDTDRLCLIQVYKAFYQSELVATKVFPLEARAKGEVCLAIDGFFFWDTEYYVCHLGARSVSL